MDMAGQYHTGLSKGHHHKGPRQAGNKSLLSFVGLPCPPTRQARHPCSVSPSHVSQMAQHTPHCTHRRQCTHGGQNKKIPPFLTRVFLLPEQRAGHGITGYVGFIPSTESIPIPNKEGPSCRAGQDSDFRRAAPEWQFKDLLQAPSIYQDSIDRINTAKDPRPDSAPLFTKPKPSKTREEDFGGVGGDRPAPRCFLATSSHKAEFRGGKNVGIVPSVTPPPPLSPTTKPVPHHQSPWRDKTIRYQTMGSGTRRTAPASIFSARTHVTCI